MSLDQILQEGLLSTPKKILPRTISCLVVHNAQAAKEIQRKLDPHGRIWYVTYPGAMLAGRRFDEILVTDYVLRRAYERREEHPTTMDWLRHLKRKLTPNGKYVEL